MWTDKWLPANSSHRVLSPIQILDENAKVSELIDKEREEWKSDLVKQLLCPTEADLVLSIPLSIKLPPDKLV